MVECYIRSYHNGDKALWRKRWERTKSFLKFFTDYKFPCIIVAQCWEDDMVADIKKEFPQIEFDRQGKLGCGGAWNYIAKTYLYPTEKDAIFIMDDDLKLVQKFGAEAVNAFFLCVEKNITKLGGGLGVNNTAYNPYCLEYLVDENVCQNGKLVGFPVYPRKTKTNAFFVYNTRKHYGKDLYTRDAHPETGNYVHEDWWLGAVGALAGIPSYHMPLFHINSRLFVDDVIGSERSAFWKNLTESTAQAKIDFQKITGVNYDKVKTYGEKMILPLEKPVELDWSQFDISIRPEDKIEYLKSADNAIPHNKEREEALKGAKNKTVLADVRKEELLWLRTYRKKISAFTSTLPEEYAKAGKLLNITTSDFHVKNIAEDELKKMNENTMKWYIGTAKTTDGIATFEKLRMLVLQNTGKLDKDVKFEKERERGALDEFF